MKTITSQSVNALLSGRKFKKSNMEVSYNSVTGCAVMCLHDNIIAKYYPAVGHLFITNAGYFTNTTKERLNGLPGVDIRQKKIKWYLNGQIWNGKKTQIMNDGSWMYVS